MIIQALVFYLFAGITVASGIMVISAKNPVHSVLWLILAFFNAAGLFVLLGAEYIAMTLVIVYVGAVAVLFLFVVMMLDIDATEIRQGFLQYLPLGGLIGLILLGELIMVLGGWTSAEASDISLSLTRGGMTNAHAIGNILYTQYFYLFQAAGLILLVAMIGAIVLTLRSRSGVRRQDVTEQHMRTVSGAIEVKKVQSGEGI